MPTKKTQLHDISEATSSSMSVLPESSHATTGDIISLTSVESVLVSPEKLSHNVTKLELAHEYLNPVINAIITGAARYTRSELSQLLSSKVPICSISYCQYMRAFNASKILQEVKRDVSGNEYLHNEYVLRVTEYSQPYNAPQAEERIYIDRDLMKQLVDLHEMISDTIGRLRTSIDDMYDSTDGRGAPQNRIDEEERKYRVQKLEDDFIVIDTTGPRPKETRKEEPRPKEPRKEEPRPEEPRKKEPRPVPKKTVDIVDSPRSYIIRSDEESEPPSDSTRPYETTDAEATTTGSLERPYESGKCHRELVRLKSVFNEISRTLTSMADEKSSGRSDLCDRISEASRTQLEIMECIRELQQIKSVLKDIDSEQVSVAKRCDVVEGNCCGSSDVPHIHAKINGIPVAIRVNEEILQSLVAAEEPVPDWPPPKQCDCRPKNGIQLTYDPQLSAECPIMQKIQVMRSTSTTTTTSRRPPVQASSSGTMSGGSRSAVVQKSPTVDRSLQVGGGQPVIVQPVKRVQQTQESDGRLPKPVEPIKRDQQTQESSDGRQPKRVEPIKRDQQTQTDDAVSLSRQKVKSGGPPGCFKSPRSSMVRTSISSDVAPPKAGRSSLKKDDPLGGPKPQPVSSNKEVGVGPQTPARPQGVAVQTSANLQAKPPQGTVVSGEVPELRSQQTKQGVAVQSPVTRPLQGTGEAPQTRPQQNTQGIGVQTPASLQTRPPQGTGASGEVPQARPLQATQSAAVQTPVTPQTRPAEGTAASRPQQGAPVPQTRPPTTQKTTQGAAVQTPANLATDQPPQLSGVKSALDREVLSRPARPSLRRDEPVQLPSLVTTRPQQAMQAVQTPATRDGTTRPLQNSPLQTPRPANNEGTNRPQQTMSGTTRPLQTSAVQTPRPQQSSVMWSSVSCDAPRQQSKATQDGRGILRAAIIDSRMSATEPPPPYPRNARKLAVTDSGKYTAQTLTSDAYTSYSRDAVVRYCERLQTDTYAYYESPSTLLEQQSSDGCLPYSVHQKSLPNFDVCPPKNVDLITLKAYMRPEPTPRKRLKYVGTDSLIGASLPAECCRTAVINEREAESRPFCASLDSLPLSSSEMELERTLARRRLLKSTFEYYTNFQANFASNIDYFVPRQVVYEVRFFEIFSSRSLGERLFRKFRRRRDDGGTKKRKHRRHHKHHQHKHKRKLRNRRVQTDSEVFYSPSSNSLPKRTWRSEGVQCKIADEMGDNTSLSPKNYAQTLSAIYGLDDDGVLRPKIHLRPGEGELLKNGFLNSPGQSFFSIAKNRVAAVHDDYNAPNRHLHDAELTNSVLRFLTSDAAMRAFEKSDVDIGKFWNVYFDSKQPTAVPSLPTSSSSGNNRKKRSVRKVVPKKGLRRKYKKHSSSASSSEAASKKQRKRAPSQIADLKNPDVMESLDKPEEPDDTYKDSLKSLERLAGKNGPGYISVLHPICGCPEVSIFIPCYCDERGGGTSELTAKKIDQLLNGSDGRHIVLPRSCRISGSGAIDGVEDENFTPP